MRERERNLARERKRRNVKEGERAIKDRTGQKERERKKNYLRQ